MRKLQRLTTPKRRNNGVVGNSQESSVESHVAVPSRGVSGKRRLVATTTVRDSRKQSTIKGTSSPVLPKIENGSSVSSRLEKFLEFKAQRQPNHQPRQPRMSSLKGAKLSATGALQQRYQLATQIIDQASVSPPKTMVTSQKDDSTSANRRQIQLHGITKQRLSEAEPSTAKLSN